jgi:hypothetical protein
MLRRKRLFLLAVLLYFVKLHPKFDIEPKAQQKRDGVQITASNVQTLSKSPE